MSTSFIQDIRTHVGRDAGRFLWLGVALLVIGAAALVYPAVSSLAAAYFVGGVLVVSGAATLFGAFSIRGAGPFFGALLLGLLSVAAGVFIFARPLSGELAITLGLGALFMIQGAFELMLAFELRSAKGWGWMLASSVASILLSLVILAGWPGTSLVALGIVMGVNFISSGLAYLMVGGAVRREIHA